MKRRQRARAGHSGAIRAAALVTARRLCHRWRAAGGARGKSMGRSGTGIAGRRAGSVANINAAYRRGKSARRRDNWPGDWAARRRAQRR